jgi:DNA-nicking Smr family endonuclease
MAKKKKTSKLHPQEFNNNPLSDLRGFAVPRQKKKKSKFSVPAKLSEKVFGSFAEEMEMLGVQRLNKDKGVKDEAPGCSSHMGNVVEKVENQTDEDFFLAAMNDLSMRFEDHLLEDDSKPVATPRRMKRLKQGKLTPDASFDLHGFQRAEVVGKLRYFLQNAQYQGWQTLLVITGKGLHSEDGEPILRDEAELFLSGEGKKFIAEWGRAPKQYGGDGVLVLFLRKK